MCEIPCRLLRASLLVLSVLFWGCPASLSADEPADGVCPVAQLPAPGSVVVDQQRSEVILSARVQFPDGKPCINDYGQRIQAFAGCAAAAGGDAKMATYFVFLVDVPTEKVFDGLMRVGARPLVHYSIQEGRKRSGLTADTKPEDYLQGDPVVLSVCWQNGRGEWVERPYEYFVTEQITVDEKLVEKPWTPHFVFHGSGAIHSSGTGCIACPCDCPGGIIADNRYPIYDPKPMVKFDMSKAPPVGTQVYVRIRVIATSGGGV
jgi:hypothetical protein